MTKQPTDIYIVEDDPVWMTFLQNLLESHNYSVKVFESSGLAHKQLQIEIPRLMILDLNLPDYRGDELLRKISVDCLWGEMAIFVVTSDATHKDLEPLKTLGVAKIYSKPIVASAFMKDVQSVLSNG